MMKVFYAHPASISPQGIERDTQLLKEALELKYQRFHPGRHVRVRSGRSDHHVHYRGDWEAWQQSVVNRKHVTTGELLYDLFAVSGNRCGRATANILRLAMESGRKVIWWDGQSPGRFKRVLSIRVNDEEDWTGGWEIVCDLPKTEQLPLPFSKEASQ
tara:strand:- start:2454 stop:2927 length:474 start_codon:yes stop_codon:yes gene_type:complete